MNIAESSELSTIFKYEIPEKNQLVTEVLEHRNNSYDFSITEPVSLTSLITADVSPESLIVENTVPEPNIEKNDSSKQFKPMKLEVEELKESIIFQTEETEEMLEMISNAKKKLEFFIVYVERLVSSLQELPKYSDTHSKFGNTYLKNMYGKKLREFSSVLLDKVRNSLKYLEDENETLKKHEKKTGEIFEFCQICDPCAPKNSSQAVEQLKERVEHLAEEILLFKTEQLREIENVSFIETDIEMLHDLYRRYLHTEGSKSISFQFDSTIPKNM